MLSMTGYGNAVARRGPWTATVELRSVNHRFLDVALRLPGPLASLEQEIRNHLKEHIGRGRVSVSVQLEGDRTDPAVLLPPAALERGMRLLGAMADHLAAAGQPRPVITLDHLLALPDLFRADPDPETLTRQREAVLEALAAATINAAWALRRGHEVGCLAPGYRADFLLLDGDDYRLVPYRAGHNPVRAAWRGGRRVTP